MSSLYGIVIGVLYTSRVISHNNRSRVGTFSPVQLVGRLYPCPPIKFPSFITRGATHHRHERPLLAKEGTIRGGFASTFLIHGVNRFFYMPQSWDMGEILSLPFRRKACGEFFRFPEKISNDFSRV